MTQKLFPNREWEIYLGGKFDVQEMIGHEVSELEDKTYKQFECFWMEFLLYKLIPTFSKRYGPITMTWSLKNMINEEKNMVDKFYDEYYKPWAE
jgi:hypothetical protein